MARAYRACWSAGVPVLLLRRGWPSACLTSLCGWMASSSSPPARQHVSRFFLRPASSIHTVARPLRRDLVLPHGIGALTAARGASATTEGIAAMGRRRQRDDNTSAGSHGAAASSPPLSARSQRALKRVRIDDDTKVKEEPATAAASAQSTQGSPPARFKKEPAGTPQHRQQFAKVKAEPGIETGPSIKAESGIKNEAAASAPPKLKRRSSSVRAPLVKPRPAPPQWQATWDLVVLLRQIRDAPVDHMGCEVLPQRPPEVDEMTTRFQTLVALLLSSQTKDQVTAEAMGNLQRHGLTIDNIIATDPKTLDSLIAKVGFHNNKTKYLKQTALMLRERFASDVPNNLDDLVSLPGIGPKMAMIALNVAFGNHLGIGVDTHVHRIMNQIRWVKSKDAEDTRVQLESWLPRPYWKEVNLLFVGLGQMVKQQPATLLRRTVALPDDKVCDAIRLVFQLGVKETLRCKATGETVLHFAVVRHTSKDVTTTAAGTVDLIRMLLVRTGKSFASTRDKAGRTPGDLTTEPEVRRALQGDV
eukprot:m.110048 g.110048  ORF g.110048 m.110048 type:complete len:531 (-) comp16015_c2_seq2:137-1729(-)